ncbi:MAG: metallophosphoesterase [Ardenticatenaceae bacterium]|nr:metallophosphoesterase [Anaerolineales bacterium]MCB8922687.1 metallophosphoesterase [Ardenticatenaceae bacterium]MCB8991764.1 metallophosphoesterase [Ardenticatenaceae bacterium]MCB9003605.1 metallophosphoesterase [Ardenticatenaceae bacterium]
MTKEPGWARIRDISEGTLMVITDLHGDWDAYQRYRDRFLQLHDQGHADYFVITGDLIHYSGAAEEDHSLDMVLDVLNMQATLGDRVIYLLGNHEIPHIYSITLQKGKQLYTPPFEAALGQHRHRVLALFDSLPLYVRTGGGVSISHAGAAPVFSDQTNAARLFLFSHKRVWRETAESLTADLRPSLRRALGRSSKRAYDEIIRDYFAVTGPDDPRYDHFLIGAVATTSHPDFQLLWEALFTRNELQYGEEAYELMQKSMLDALSRQFAPQRVLVSGHIDCKGGYKLVGESQLRFASAKHAHPRESGVYLLIDTAKQVKTAVELIPDLGNVFRESR